MKITRQELRQILLEEVEFAYQSGELSEEQLQELLPGLKALGKAAWGGIKKGAAKVRDIYKSGEAEASAAKAAKKSAGVPTPAAPADQVPTVQSVATTPADQVPTVQSVAAPKQVPIFKSTPDSKGDVLLMKLKTPFSKVPNGQQLLTQYLKMISNQLKANDVKLMEAEGDNLAAQISGFKSKTAQNAGTAANIQKGSIDLFGPAVLLLKQVGLDQKSAVMLATQVKDLTAKHLQKYGVNLPQKTSRSAKPVTTPVPVAMPKPTPAPVELETPAPVEIETSIPTPVKEVSELNESFKRWKEIIKG